MAGGGAGGRAGRRADGRDGRTGSGLRSAGHDRSTLMFVQIVAKDSAAPSDGPVRGHGDRCVHAQAEGYRCDGGQLPGSVDHYPPHSLLAQMPSDNNGYCPTAAPGRMKSFRDAAAAPPPLPRRRGQDCVRALPES